MIVVAYPKFPAKNVQELIAIGKQKPGTINFASAGQGVKGFDVLLWHGLIGPKNLPKPAVERINAEVNKILKIPETAKQLETDGVAPAGGDAQRFGEQIRKEIGLWKDVVAKTGVKVQ